MNMEETMETSIDPSVTEKTKTYYDSEDANSFYGQIWGGEDIHIGIYEKESDTIFDASRRTVIKMAELVPTLRRSSGVLDIGSGFGGSARFLATKYGCSVQCLNLSETQNAENRRLNLKSMVNDHIKVDTGNFEDLPYNDDSFDVVWCQDAILHSSNRGRVLGEAYRVLRPKGTFIFTDPMQDKHSAQSCLQPVLDRIHLDSLSTVTGYQKMAASTGFKESMFLDLSGHLTTHYRRVLAALAHHESRMAKSCSEEYIARMKVGLQHWVNAGQSGDLRWGIFRFRKV